LRERWASHRNGKRDDHQLLHFISFQVAPAPTRRCSGRSSVGGRTDAANSAESCAQLERLL
jgi:hypothetical protein